MMYLAVGRLLTGYASGVTSVIIPIYLGELAPPDLRGGLGFLGQVVYGLGLLASLLLGLLCSADERKLRLFIALGIVAASATTQYAFCHMLPESPPWLVGRSAVEAVEAERVMQRLRRGSQHSRESPATLMRELDYMQLAVLTDGDGGRGTLRALFCDQSLRTSLLMISACQAAHGFCSTTLIVSFTSTAVRRGGTSASTIAISNLLMGILGVIATLFSARLLQHIPRKQLLTLSALGMLGALFLLALVPWMSQSSSWPMSVAGLSMLLLVGSYGIGVARVPWLLAAELLPARAVTAGFAWAAVCYALASLLASLMLPILSATLGALYLSPFFVVLLLLVTGFAAKLPETRGKKVDILLGEMHA